MIAKIVNDKTIEVYDPAQFDWYAIRNSGQIFREPPCEFIECQDKIIITATGDKDSARLWDYFDLGTDYEEIKKELAHVEALQKPLKAGGGIRILRQPFVETVICFIISANNNIKRFTKTISLLCEKYGDKQPNGQYSFPTLEQLAVAAEADFKATGCGYRAPYLVKAVKQLQALDFETLNTLPDDLLAKRLLAISGVGQKVASCIMLFCFHRLCAAPVDTWIKKTVEQLCEHDRNAIFGHKYAGVAQQYIFFYLQHLRKELRETR